LQRISVAVRCSVCRTADRHDWNRRQYYRTRWTTFPQLLRLLRSDFLSRRSGKQPFSARHIWGQRVHCIMIIWFAGKVEHDASTLDYM